MTSVNITITMLAEFSVYEDLTPEERYEAYLAWIDQKLAETVNA